jgi:hypothetical protein
MTMHACPSCGNSREIRASRAATNPLCARCAHELCCSREKRLGAANPAWKGTDHIPSSRFNNWRKNAERRGLPWEITIHDVEALWESQQGRCALTGATLLIATNQIRGHTDIDREAVLSLDRIDNSRGYTIDNIQLTTWRTNRIKNDLSNEALFAFCRQVLEGIASSALEYQEHEQGRDSL